MTPTKVAQQWLALWLVPKIGPKTLMGLYNAFGSIEAVHQASFKELITLGLKPELAEKVQASLESDNLKDELQRIEQYNLQMFCIQDDAYPTLLKEVQYSPPILYQKGNLDLNQGLFLGFVGSRKASFAGKNQCKRIIESLQELHENIIVVSGLALGVDAAAHQAALDCGLPTVGVLAGGLSKIYPTQNKQLAENMLLNGGCWLTEFPTMTQPLAAHFPLRNRIISGISRGVLVVEAGHRSGATITASYALEQGRELFAFPGPPDSPYSIGTNRLIQKGSAKLVMDAKDILEELTPYTLHMDTKDQNPQAAVKAPPKGDTELEQQILDLLHQKSHHQDMIVDSLGVAAHLVMSNLVTLEMKGLIFQKTGSNFELA